MKMYKIEVLFVDHENIGEEKIRSLIETNNSIKVKVKRIESEELKNWYDVHPMNKLNRTSSKNS